jgi:hypothetical protein
MEKREVLLEKFLAENHQNYLSKSHMIGFMEAFPEDPKGVVDEIIVKAQCRKFDVSFKVRYGKVTFGPENQHSVMGITTDTVSISERLPLNGFNSHCCFDEAETMEKAVVEMAKKHNLMICDKRCSWPHAKAIVQTVSDSMLGIKNAEKEIEERIYKEKMQRHEDSRKLHRNCFS